VNFLQRLTWVATVALFLLSVLVPPWTLHFEAGEERLRFGPIFDPPILGAFDMGLKTAKSQSISVGLLLLEWFALALAAMCLHWALRSAPPRGTAAS